MPYCGLQTSLVGRRVHRLISAISFDFAMFAFHHLRASVFLTRIADVFLVHGYDHCMPYGQYSPLLIEANPSVSVAVPFACRLSPLHPGYVMTVCAIALCIDASSAIAQAVVDDSILIDTMQVTFEGCGGMGRGIRYAPLSNPRRAMEVSK